MTKTLLQQQQYCFQGPAYVFVKTRRERYTVPPLDLSYSGNDSLDILPEFLPRPSTGWFLGPTQNLVEDWGQNLNEVPQNGNSSKVPADHRVSDENYSIKGLANFAGLAKVAALFQPNGLSNGSYFSFGGHPNPKKCSVLIIRVNNLQEPQDYYEAHYYYQCAIVPSKVQTTPKGYQVLDINLLPECGLREDGCYLPIGQQAMVGWFFRVDQNTGNNALVHPSYPDVDLSTPSFAPYF